MLEAPEAVTQMQPQALQLDAPAGAQTSEDWAEK